MGSVKRRAQHLESAISICLLMVLVLVAIGVVLKQQDADLSRFGIDSAAAELLSYKSSSNNSEKSALSSLLPDGFRVLSEIEVYNPENLYEKINGKAPVYIEAGFRELLAQRFASKEDENLWLEISVYDMAKARNAFSVFSIQRRPGATMPRTLDPQYAYRTSNSLYCVNGHYYIEMVGSAESNELFQVMVELRNEFSKKLPVDEVIDIAELGLFPAENFVQGSARLNLNSAFGFEGLTDTYAASYRFGDETITAFISKRPNSDDASTVAESYHKFLIDNGGVAKPSTDDRYKVLDFYGTTEIVFAIGPFVAGIHEAENLQSAQELAAKLINKLSEAAKAVNID